MTGRITRPAPPRHNTGVRVSPERRAQLRTLRRYNGMRALCDMLHVSDGTIEAALDDAPLMPGTVARLEAAIAKAVGT